MTAKRKTSAKAQAGKSSKPGARLSATGRPAAKVQAASKQALPFRRIFVPPAERCTIPPELMKQAVARVIAKREAAERS